MVISIVSLTTIWYFLLPVSCGITESTRVAVVTLLGEDFKKLAFGRIGLYVLLMLLGFTKCSVELTSYFECG